MKNPNSRPGGIPRLDRPKALRFLYPYNPTQRREAWETLRGEAAVRKFLFTHFGEPPLALREQVVAQPSSNRVTDTSALTVVTPSHSGKIFMQDVAKRKKAYDRFVADILHPDVLRLLTRRCAFMKYEREGDMEIWTYSLPGFWRTVVTGTALAAPEELLLLDTRVLHGTLMDASCRGVAALQCAAEVLIRQDMNAMDWLAENHDLPVSAPLHKLYPALAVAVANATWDAVEGYRLTVTQRDTDELLVTCTGKGWTRDVLFRVAGNYSQMLFNPVTGKRFPLVPAEGEPWYHTGVVPQRFREESQSQWRFNPYNRRPIVRTAGYEEQRDASYVLYVRQWQRADRDSVPVTERLQTLFRLETAREYCADLTTIKLLPDGRVLVDWTDEFLLAVLAAHKIYETPKWVKDGMLLSAEAVAKLLDAVEDVLDLFDVPAQ